ncbi:MAG: DinB family protein [Armatimonadota bacterium]
MRETLLYGLDATHTRMHKCLEDLTEDEARRSPDGLTPIIWQVGHIALVDAMFARRVDDRSATPSGYEDLFKAGTGGEANYPPLREVTDALNRSQQTVKAIAETVDAATPIDSPRYRNVGEMLTFLVYHRGYHVGKVTTLRALMKKARLFG